MFMFIIGYVGEDDDDDALQHRLDSCRPDSVTATTCASDIYIDKER